MTHILSFVDIDTVDTRKITQDFKYYIEPYEVLDILSNRYSMRSTHSDIVGVLWF